MVQHVSHSQRVDQTRGRTRVSQFSRDVPTQHARVADDVVEELGTWSLSLHRWTKTSGMENFMMLWNTLTTSSRCRVAELPTGRRFIVEAIGGMLLAYFASPCGGSLLDMLLRGILWHRLLAVLQKFLDHVGWDRGRWSWRAFFVASALGTSSWLVVSVFFSTGRPQVQLLLDGRRVCFLPFRVWGVL